jgi:hypothetical protein
VGVETWLLMWYCVTITNPACKEWDGATEKLVTSFSSEADCVSYAKKIARKVHTAERAFRQSRMPPVAVHHFKLRRCC